MEGYIEEITLPEVAELARAKPSKVLEWVRDKELKPVRMSDDDGFIFSRAHVDRFLKERRAYLEQRFHDVWGPMELM